MLNLTHLVSSDRHKFLSTKQHSWYTLFIPGISSLQLSSKKLQGMGNGVRNNKETSSKEWDQVDDVYNHHPSAHTNGFVPISAQ